MGPGCEIAAVICTFNRCVSLRRTLETLCELDIPPGLEWEVLIVDNNSKDSTREVCEEFRTRLPIRSVFEERQGLSAARNRATRETMAEVMAFTDDDVDVDQGWLVALRRAAGIYTDGAFFGGKILPRWEGRPPAWMTRHSREISGVTMHFDRGDAAKIVEGKGDTFFGANMAFRRRVFQGGRGFSEELGVKGKTFVPGEESDFMRGLLATGEKGYYVPEMIVYHRNPVKRMTEKFLRQWYVGRGRADVRKGEVKIDLSSYWFGVGRWYWMELCRSALKYCMTRWTCSSKVWLPAEIRMATTWGNIVEGRKLVNRREK